MTPARRRLVVGIVAIGEGVTLIVAGLAIILIAAGLALPRDALGALLTGWLR